MDQGDDQVGEEILREISQLPNKGNILVLNHTGDTVEIYKFPQNNSF